MEIGVLVSKMSTLLVLLAIGYICAKLNVTNDEFNKSASKVTISVFLVAMIISSVANKEILMTGKELAFGIAMMFAFTLISIFIAFLTPKVFRIKDGDIGMYMLLVGFMNTAFFGFPVIQAMYGEEAIFYASTSGIPFNIMIYTLGVWWLNKNRGDGIKLNAKDIFTPPLIATIISIFIFAFNLHIPVFIDETCDLMSGAAVPLSMFIVGSSLGDVSLKEAFGDRRMYLLSFVRLIVCPLIIWLLFKPIIPNPVMLGTIVILAATPMPVIATILGLQYGRDGVESSKGIFLSTVLSLFTMPLIIYFCGL